MVNTFPSKFAVGRSSAFNSVLSCLRSTTSSSPGLVVGEAGVGSGVFEDPGSFVEAGEDWGSVVADIAVKPNGPFSFLCFVDMSLFRSEEASSISTSAGSDPFRALSSLDGVFRPLWTSKSVGDVSKGRPVLALRVTESLDASSMSMGSETARSRSGLPCLEG
jgi:hypothetical protein